MTLKRATYIICSKDVYKFLEIKDKLNHMNTNEAMMRKLSLITLLILSTSTFAFEEYCPQSISCFNKQCSGFSTDFYIDWRNPTPSPDGIYSFTEAEYAPTKCVYEISSEMQSPRLSISSHNVSPDTRVTGNHWGISGGGGEWCTPANKDPHSCPFYHVG